MAPLRNLIHLSVWAVLFVGATYAATTPTCSSSVDVIFVVDSSTSVGEEAFHNQMTWSALVTEQFKLAPVGELDAQGARFAAVVYSRSVKPLFGLGYLDKHELLREGLISAPYLAESSHTHAALMTVIEYDLFSEFSGGRPNAKNVVVLISDGRASLVTEARMAAYYLKSAGVTMMTVALQDDPDTIALRQLASDWDKDVFVVNEGASDLDLASLAYEVSQRICEVAITAA